MNGNGSRSERPVFQFSAAQRQFVSAGPVAALRTELQRHTAEPVELADVLTHVERYEQTRLSSDARRLAEDCRYLSLVQAEPERRLAESLERDYRNANLRLAVTGELLNRLMPERDPEVASVRDTVLGVPVRGRSLTSTIVAREVPPLCHPLSAENKLVVACGFLSGTTSANSGRLSVGAKSPLTGGIKESNVGGNAAYKMGRLGIAGIVVEGQPAEGKLFCLLVNKDGAQLLPADDLKGLKNYDLAAKLQGKYGEKVGIVSIGPAGEM